MRAWLFVLVLCCSSAGASSAFASFGLHWVRSDGAERCIDPRSLAQRIESLTGPVFVAPAAAQNFIEGEVRAEKLGFRVRLRLIDKNLGASNERVLATRNADCRTLDATIAFIIALTIDPSLSLTGVPPDVLAQFAQEIPPEDALLAELEQTAPAVVPPHSAASASVLASAAPVVAAPAKSKPKSEPATEGKARSMLALAGTALLGALPGVTPGVQASYAVNISRSLALQLGARALLPSSPQVLTGGQRAIFRGYDFSVSGCSAASLWRTLRVRGCLGALLARLEAEGQGFDANRRGHLWDPALTLSMGLVLGIRGGVGLLAEASGRVRLSQTAFEQSQGDGTRRTAYAPGRFGGIFTLGPVYEF